MNFSSTERQRLTLARFMNWSLLILVLFEAVSLACWLLVPFFPSVFNPRAEGLVSSVLNSESWLFYFSAALAPVFVVFMMLSWVPRLFVWLGEVYTNRQRKRIHGVLALGGRKISFDKLLTRMNSALNMAFEPATHSSKRHWLVLALSIALVLSIAAYPYLPGVNPAGKTVGADVEVYAAWLTDIDKQGSLSNAFSYVFFNFSDRPLSLSLMYFGWKALPVSALQSVELWFFLLGPLLVLATFFFTRKAGFNFWAASIASLFAGFSFHVTVGMFGGFISNWIGLLFLYLSLGFLFWSLREGSWGLLLVAAVFQVALLFAHSFTWLMFIGSLGVFSLVGFVKWLRNRSGGSEPKMVVTALVMNVAVYFGRNLVLSAGPVSASVVQVFEQNVSLSFIQSFWLILNRSVSAEMGISFMNPPVFFLALLGAFALAFNDKPVSRFLCVLLASSVVPFILGNWVVQTRILYNLPVHILSFFGFMLLSELFKALLGVREASRLGRLMLALIVLANLNYAFRCSFQLT
jgi:hypothetical protein